MLMRELLNEQNLQKRGFFNPRYVNRLIQQHVRGYADHATELWGLMSFEMWLRVYIDPSFSSLRERVASSRNSSADSQLAVV